MENEPPIQPRRRNVTYSLSSVLLLVTLIAVGLAWQITRTNLHDVTRSLQASRLISRELRVEDLGQIAVVYRHPTLPGEWIADVFIPAVAQVVAPGEESQNQLKGFELCMALEKIIGKTNDNHQFPEPLQRASLAPGRHSIEIKHVPPDRKDPTGVHRVEVLIDGVISMKTTRSPLWDTVNGWTSTTSYLESQSFDPRKAVEVHRRRFYEPTTTGSRSPRQDKPVNGVLIWISPK